MAIQLNDLEIYDVNAERWWDGSVRWLRTLHNMVPARLRYFERFVDDWANTRVLDVGCGGGFMAEALALRTAKVAGLDPSSQAIRAAQAHALANGLAIDYQTGRAEQLPFDDHSFDFVVCVDVLEHVDDLKQATSEMARVLKPGGLFLFDTINRNWLAKHLVVTAAERVVGLLPRGAHDPSMFITPDELRTMLAKSRMPVIEFAGLGPVGMNRRLDIVFGQVPTTLVQYMGVARKTAQK